jgi:tetratricopeptide (TPR) repeat protein
MRKVAYIILLALISGGCTHEAVRSTSDIGETAKNDNRYDYMLTEALRQKYVGDVNEATKLFEKCIDMDKSRAVPYFELAQVYSAAGMGSKSVEYASRAARLEPENFWYQLACGSLFTQYEKKDSALVYFKRAAAADPKSVEVKSILAGLYAERGDSEKADSLFSLLSREGVLSDDMFLMMISGLIRKGEMKEAALRTEKLIEKEPEEIKYRALLADIYYEAGKNERGDSIYKAIIEEDPENIENQLIYLLNLVQKKEYKDISGFLDNIFESELVEKERKIAVAGRLISDTAYVTENSRSLEESLLILENKYPDDEKVMSLRPAMYETAGRKEDAIKRYEEIIGKVKNGFYFKEQLILLYAEKKEYRKLYNLAGEYSSENNMSILGKVYYAIAAMELGEYEVADRELKKAMILAGNNNILKVQILSMMGDLKYRMKDADAAYGYYEEALKLNPDEVLVLNNYAYFLAEGGRDLKKALKMAEKVMQTEGENSTYIDTYAWVLYKMGKYREAYKAMLRIFEKQEERDPEILEHMGFILKALGKCSEATEYWKLSVETDSTKTYLEEEILKCGKN